jgi:hypothetical protein
MKNLSSYTGQGSNSSGVPPAITALSPLPGTAWLLLFLVGGLGDEPHAHIRMHNEHFLDHVAHRGTA